MGPPPRWESRPYLSSTTDTLDAQRSHKPLYSASNNSYSFSIELLPDLSRTLYSTKAFLLHTQNVGTKHLISFDSKRTELWMLLSSFLLVLDRCNNRYVFTDRPDSVFLPVHVFESNHHFGRRSSSACGKYSDALRRISLAFLSSRFSSSSSFRRFRTSVISPSRRPSSVSLRRTHLRRVSEVHSILLDIEQIAAHWEPCSASSSNTSLTARS